MDIVLAYYKGGYGETVRIDTQTVGQLKAVRDLFSSLARGEHVTADFCAAVQAKRDEIAGLVLRVARDEPVKRLQLAGHREHGPLYEWTRSPAGWQLCAAMLDPMLDADEPSHQYLTDETSDDALVEVALKEYRPPGLQLLD